MLFVYDRYEVAKQLSSISLEVWDGIIMAVAFTFGTIIGFKLSYLRHQWGNDTTAKVIR